MINPSITMLSACSSAGLIRLSPFIWRFLRRIVCRRFGASICLRTRAPRCKNDRGFAESVKRRRSAMPGSAKTAPEQTRTGAKAQPRGLGGHRLLGLGGSFHAARGRLCSLLEPWARIRRFNQGFTGLEAALQ
ncbi:hypothetical protein GDH07_02550 [Pseudomonas sp. MC042]|uniref:Uncharacterized protein n=1 Tax=Pseudomonas piscis TaxID=2614538 RepID=A0A7X1U2R4_9PSED|nr:hypothetical protein [Pseudomonas piscis]